MWVKKKTSDRLNFQTIKEVKMNPEITILLYLGNEGNHMKVVLTVNINEVSDPLSTILCSETLNSLVNDKEAEDCKDELMSMLPPFYEELGLAMIERIERSFNGKMVEEHIASQVEQRRKNRSNKVTVGGVWKEGNG